MSVRLKDIILVIGVGILIVQVFAREVFLGYNIPILIITIIVLLIAVFTKDERQ